MIKEQINKYLVSVFGINTEAMELWEGSYNHGLRAVPSEMMMTQEGAQEVLEYLQKMLNINGEFM